MAQRLNKKLVVGLTVAGMGIITVAGAVLVTYLPGRDPEPVAKQAAAMLAEAATIDAQIKEKTRVLTSAPAGADADNLQQEIVKLESDWAEKNETAGKYYAKAYTRAMSANKPQQANDYMISAGDTALQGGEYRGAMECWKRVLLNTPNHEKAQEKIVQLILEQAEMYGQDWWGELKKEAERLGDSTNQGNLVGMHALGRALVEPQTANEADLKKGEELLRKAFDQDNASPRFAESLAMFILHKHERAIAEARRVSGNVAALEAKRDEVVASAVGVYEALVKALDKKKPEDAAAQALRAEWEKLATTAWRQRGQLHLVVRDVYSSELRERQDRLSAPEIEGLRAKAATQATEGLACLERAMTYTAEDPQTLVLVGAYWRSLDSSALDDAARTAEVEANQAKAREYFERAVKADPSGFDAYIQLQDMYSRRAELAYLQQDKLKMAEYFTNADRVLQERVKRGTPRAGINVWRNKAMMSLVRWQLFQLNTTRVEHTRQLVGGAAETEVKPVLDRLRAVRVDFMAESVQGEKDPRAMFMKARLEMLENKPFEAIKTFRELQDLLDPGELWVRSKLYLAELYLKIEEPGPAIDALQSVVKAFPTVDSAQSMLARALFASPGREGEAEAAANQALALNPQNQEARVVLARVYEKQKNWAKLEEVHQQLTQNQPGGRNQLMEANLLLARANDPQHPDAGLVTTAQGLLRELLRSEPSNLQALRTLISTLAADKSKRGEVLELIAKAKADLSKKLNPPAAETQPSETARKQITAALSGLEFLTVISDPQTSEAERLKQTEAIIRQGTDPFLVAVELYRLFISVPGRQSDAIAQLKEAHRLKPDDPGVVEMLFRVAISSFNNEKGEEVIKPDWAMAEQMIQRLVDLQVDRSAGHYFRGQLYFARKDMKDNFVEAEKEFREGLKIFPVHSSGYAWLGRALMAQNRPQDARQALATSFSQNPRNGMAAMYLAMLASDQGDEEAKVGYLRVCRELNVDNVWVSQQLLILDDQADPVKGIQRREALRTRNPKDIENLVQLANLYDRAGNTDKVQQVLAEAYELQPKNLDFLQRYVNFLRGLKTPDYDKAEALIRKTMGLFGPTDKDQRATSQLLLAAHMEAMNNVKAAKAPAVEAVDAAYAAAAGISDNGRILLDIADRYRRINQPAKVEEWTRKAIANAMRDGDTNLERQSRVLLMQLLLQVQDPKRTADTLTEIEAYRAKFKDSVGLLAMSEYATLIGRETRAIQFATDYIAASSGQEKALGYYRRGGMNYRRGDWDLAISDFREAKALSPNGFGFQHRILLARCLQITGQSDQAVTELNSILQEDRRVLLAAQELFGIYMAGKKWDEAEAFVLPASQKDPKSPRWISLLTQVAAARGDYNTAIQRAGQTVINSDFDLRVLDNLLSIYLEFKRYDDMLEYINTKVPEAKRESFVVQARLAALNVARGDNAKASELFGKSLAGGRAEIPLFQAIVLDYPKGLGPDVALEFITREAASRPEEPLVQLLLAQMHRQKGRRHVEDARGKGSVREAEAKDAESKEIGVFTGIVEPLLLKIPKDDPKLLPLRIEALQAYADVQYGHKQFTPARKAYEEILELAPKDAGVRAVAMNNLAYMLTEDLKDPASGVRYAEQAHAMLAGQTNVLDTLGWTLILTGQYDRGIGLVRSALTTVGSLDWVQMAAVHYHAAFGLMKRAQDSQKRGMNTEAEQDLAEAKMDCRRAHGLLFASLDEGEGLLGRVVELGTSLGITLDPKLPATSQP